MKFFANHRLGGTLAMLNDDVNQLERFLNVGFNEMLQMVVLICFATPLLIVTSWRLALIGLCPVPVLLWATFYYHKLIAPRYLKVREQVGEMSSRLENNISGMLVIKSFNAEQYESNRVSEASEAYVDANIHAIKLSSKYIPAIRVVVALGFSFGLGAGVYWSMRGEHDISKADLVLFAMLIQRMLWPLVRLGALVDDFERSLAAAKRTFILLETAPTIVDAENPVLLKKTEAIPINLNKVKFRYNDKSPWVVDELNLTIKPGEFLGIAGASGGGKTTLIKLLLRLWEVDGGSVNINDINVKDTTLNNLRENIALVSQDVYIFHGTLRENICYGYANATDEEIQKSSKKCHIYMKKL
eukprot:UN33381